MGRPPGGGVQAPHLLSGHAARPGAHLSGSTAPLPCGQGGSPSRPPAAPALPFCPPSSSSAAPHPQPFLWCWPEPARPFNLRLPRQGPAPALTPQALRPSCPLGSHFLCALCPHPNRSAGGLCPSHPLLPPRLELPPRQDPVVTEDAPKGRTGQPRNPRAPGGEPVSHWLWRGR